jgi:putative heme-binding domain-containing protein
MVGTLAVVKDVEAYLASHSESQQPKITEWKLEDLAPELSKVAYGRNLESGKSLFTQLACVQCHKLGKQGYAYGPDLTEVLARYKNDRASVLQQILEPSKVIEERYRNVNFELKGAEPVTGMVLKEDSQTVSIQTGPADSLIQTLNKSEIQQRQPQTSSPMPVGLLNALSKDQIFDLLAYLESGGNTDTHAHQH